MPKLRVFVVGQDGTVSSEDKARDIANADHDTQLRKAKELLAGEGMFVRSVSMSTDGELLAYVYPPGAEPKRSKMIEGWQHKLPSIAPRK